MRDPLGYGLRALLLVLPPAPSYRAAPPSDDPLERAARRLAPRDRDAGIYPRDWPAEDKQRWPVDGTTYPELMRAVRCPLAVRTSSRRRLPGPSSSLLLAAVAALARLGAPRVQAGNPRVAGLRARARHVRRVPRTARSDPAGGVTPATAPRPDGAAHWPVYFVGVPAYLLRRRRRGEPGRALPWTFRLATAIVQHDQRSGASWNRAYGGYRGHGCVQEPPIGSWRSSPPSRSSCGVVGLVGGDWLFAGAMLLSACEHAD